MPRTCTICNHPDRATIDEALLAGEPFRHIAQRTATSTRSLFRHKEEHLPVKLQKSAAAREIREADSLAAKIQAWERRTLTLYEDAVELLEKAKQSGESRTAIAAINATRGVIGEARELHRLMGELSQQIAPAGASVVVLAPLLLNVLAAANIGPEARALLARRLMELDRTLQLPAA